VTRVSHEESQFITPHRPSESQATKKGQHIDIVIGASIVLALIALFVVEEAKSFNLEVD
jgi:hypothetical protein